jgi:hypothetical protein
MTNGAKTGSQSGGVGGKAKKKRNTVPIPKDEKPEARFLRVVTPRVRKALKYIKAIGSCSGTAYKSSSEQVAKMFRSLTDAVETAEHRYMEKAKQGEDFNF